MKIEEIKLLASRLDFLKDFYSDVLELPIIEYCDSTLSLLAGSSQLTFIRNSSVTNLPLGDEEGLFILSSLERNWLGSNKKVEVFPLEVTINKGRNETNKLLEYPYKISGGR